MQARRNSASAAGTRAAAVRIRGDAADHCQDRGRGHRTGPFVGRRDRALLVTGFSFQRGGQQQRAAVRYSVAAALSEIAQTGRQERIISLGQAGPRRQLCTGKRLDGERSLLDPDPGAVDGWLQALRDRAGLSYVQLSERCEGTSTSTLQKMVTGESFPRAATMRLFVRACGERDAQPWVDARNRVQAAEATLQRRRTPPGQQIWVGAVPQRADCFQDREVAAMLEQAAEEHGTVVLTQVLAGPLPASLKAEDQTYASAAEGRPTTAGSGDLSRMTIREAILAVLAEAKPEPVRVRDLDRMMAERGKKVQGGVSVDLTTLKQAGEVLNPSWGYWTVP